LLDIFIKSDDLEADRDGERQILTYGDKLELSDFQMVTGGGQAILRWLFRDWVYTLQ
jgi:hypothetical protein